MALVLAVEGKSRFERRSIPPCMQRPAGEYPVEVDLGDDAPEIEQQRAHRVRRDDFATHPLSATTRSSRPRDRARPSPATAGNIPDSPARRPAGFRHSHRCPAPRPRRSRGSSVKAWWSFDHSHGLVSLTTNSCFDIAQDRLGVLAVQLLLRNSAIRVTPSFSRSIEFVYAKRTCRSGAFV